MKNKVINFQLLIKFKVFQNQKQEKEKEKK